MDKLTPQDVNLIRVVLLSRIEDEQDYLGDLKQHTKFCVGREMWQSNKESIAMCRATIRRCKSVLKKLGA